MITTSLLQNNFNPADLCSLEQILDFELNLLWNGKERLDIDQKVKCHWMMASKEVLRFLIFTKFKIH